MFLFFVPGKLMAALAYRDDKILARNLLLRPFFCLIPAEPFFRPDRSTTAPCVEWRSRMAALFAATRRACPCMGPSKSSTYFRAFSTSLIRVSLFDLESRFFAPTHVLDAGAHRGCQGRPSLCPGLTLRRFQAAPRLDRPEHGGTLVVVGMTRPRGARCRGTRDSRRNLVSGGSQ